MEEKKKKILIIEDEGDAAEMFAEMMRVSGYEVIQTHHGKQAIEMINQQQPDALVLDIMMPDISGLDILHYLRNNPQWVNLPVVIVSAKSTPADITAGLEAGANIYLSKPVGYMELRQAVETALKTQS